MVLASEMKIEMLTYIVRLVASHGCTIHSIPRIILQNVRQLKYLGKDDQDPTNFSLFYDF
jgi:hypothetical protein